ncbi:Wzz/FepE/Etk N-terminal domain-containing protein [Marinobacter fonticola]|uniref:Wzz/FepE/Etk N-terminal domain-containing protein n=1 Tax=Marinobacter fonticola TaxID=2603215 RepID=UPI0011E671FF|nr:Wzz/FepE/Etk N-terminal domain-containing protein [Marinobacter fonticola]
MNNAYEQQQMRDDEISLVDLAAVFVRRRYVFYIVFVVVTLAGLAYALFTSDKYEYASLLEVAEQGDGRPIEQPAAVIATIENRWLQEVSTRFRAEHEKKLPFEVNASNPEQTRLIRLSSESDKENAEVVKDIHTTLIDRVKQHQGNLISSEEKSLQRQIESLEKVIEALEGQQFAGEALARAIEKRVSLERQLEQLKPVEVLVVSRESAEKTGPRRALIVVLAGLLGGMVGVFGAFLFEFIIRVRAQLSANASA